jgi:hypothetical protein
MHLIQLLLPLRDNDGNTFPAERFEEIRHALTARFGGVTAYTHAPARGTYATGDGQVIADDIVVFEVMCEGLDREFWSAYRATLTASFAQDDLVVRALPMERL